MSNIKRSDIPSTTLSEMAAAAVLMLLLSMSNGCLGGGGITYYVDGVAHTFSIFEKKP